MATKTLGTNATTTLTAIQWQPNISDADVASINALIFDPQVIAGGPNQATWPGSGVQREIVALSKAGTLYIPGRGTVQLQPGDWVAVDPTCGSVFVIPFNALPATLTATGVTHSTTTLDGLSANVLSQGWTPGMTIAGSDITAGTYIKTIAATGTSLTLSQVATGSNSGNTYTVANFTHS